MNIARDGNILEAIVWFLMATIVFIASVRTEPRLRRTLRWLALVTLLFGGSDLVEARTGAWWRPWWLFVWKALCVAGLFAGFLRYFHLRRTKKETNP